VAACPAGAVRRSSRPSFKEEFGPELERSMDKARELLITGVTRNTLITRSYHKFEDRLRNGCRIRMLLMDPASDGVVVAPSATTRTGRQTASASACATRCGSGRTGALCRR
jgi:hypothetical protein